MSARSVRCCPALNAKASRELGGHLEADRIGVVGLGHDLGDAQRVEMLGHPTRSRRDRARGICCITASKWPRCSLWCPRRPPRIGRWSAGAASLASPSTRARSRAILVLEQRADRRRSRARSAPRASRRPRTIRGRSASTSRARRPSARALSSVPSPSRIVPVGGQLAVIGDFLDRPWPRSRADRRVARRVERAIEHVLPGREQQLPRDGPREIAIGLLDQQAILVIEHVAVERQLVGIARSRRGNASPARSGRARGWRG